MPRPLSGLPLAAASLVTLGSALAPVVTQTAAAQATATQAAAPIATDRPGLAFSPVVVPQGALQIEVGVPIVSRASGGGATSTLVNVPTGVRVGLTPRLELRATSTLVNALSVDADSGPDPDRTDGLGDVEVGVKVQVLVADGARPSLAIVPSVVLPIGTGGFSAGDPVLGLNASAGFALPRGLGATLVAGVSVPTADGASAKGTLVALLGHAFSPAVSGYVEVAAFPTDGGTPLYAGAGLAYLLSNTVQVDAALDVGLTDAALDLIGGLGISVRFGR